MAGLVDWDAIEDRTRNLKRLPTWTTPEGIIEDASEQFRHDIWRRQPYRLECWIEKEALIGVIAGTCDKWRVPYFACRGYVSASEMHAAAMRFRKYERQEQTPIIMHLGDHDPSGIDMTRDIETRLETFGCQRTGVKRLALNMPQVRKYNPPANPAKAKDSRFSAYSDLYGVQSWELDALDPRTISALIEKEIMSRLAKNAWHTAFAAERADREALITAGYNWPAVAEYISETFEIRPDPHKNPLKK